MASDQYVWLLWSSAFMIPWVLVYWVFPIHRQAMLWASVFTTPFGLTEPLSLTAMESEAEAVSPR